MSSRLFMTLREKLGLAYEVSSFYPTRLDVSLPGWFIWGCQWKTGNGHEEASRATRTSPIGVQVPESFVKRNP